MALDVPKPSHLVRATLQVQTDSDSVPGPFIPRDHSASCLTSGTLHFRVSSFIVRRQPINRKRGKLSDTLLQRFAP